VGWFSIIFLSVTRMYLSVFFLFTRMIRVFFAFYSNGFEYFLIFTRMDLSILFLFSRIGVVFLSCCSCGCWYFSIFLLFTRMDSSIF